MRFLLINTNPAVSKLVGASLVRMGYELSEIDNYNNLPIDTYMLVVVDSDSYKANYMDDILSISLAPSLLYLKTRGSETPKGISYTLEKPFLPTDFIALIASILQKTPELKRFITPEVEQLKNSILQGNAEPTDNLISPFASNIDQNYDEERKIPIFEPSEEQTISSKKADIFSSLSTELQKLYSEDEPAVSDYSPKENEGLKNQTHELRSTDAENILKRPLDTQSNGDIEEKINLDFDIFDKIEEREKQTKEDTIQEKMEDMPEKINFLLEDVDMPQDAAGSVEEDKNFGFGELAKEFDELIHNKKDGESEDKHVDINNAQVFENTLNSLSEKEMREALQESGMLPKPSKVDIIKTEIENVVERSVKGALQSQILRDVLKGLKMNITITFEDK